MRTALLGYLFVIAACGGSASNNGGDDVHPDASLGGGDDGGGGGDDDGGTTGPCTDGQTRCGGANDVQTCGNDTWTTTDVCALGCSAGACATSTTCNPGARACFGTEVGVCNSTGTGWLYESTCAATCAAGACTGACVPGTKRCSGSNIETCNSAGTAWDVAETCAHGCDSGQCALDMLDITFDTTLDGTIIVNGPVNVFAGATLRSPSGDLTIKATSITVDAGGAIEVGANGRGTDGRGGAAATCYSQGVNSSASGGGGGHAGTGFQGRPIGYTCGGFGGSPFGAGNDLSAAMGGPGGAAYAQPSVFASGGGMLHLYAPTITISGALRADGATASGTSQSDGGSGAGGSILVAADHLTVTGTISAMGGGGTGYGSGGKGFIKLLYGTLTSTGSTLSGAAYGSVSPPLTAGSLSHPDQTLYYNDDFTAAALAWPAPFAARQGYYWKVDTTKVAPPTPATGALATGEAISIPSDKLPAGDNYVHLVSIDAATNIGVTEGTFSMHINATPPALTSQTHPTQAWSTNHDPLIAWTLPHGDASYRGVYYALDHYGDTRPAATDTFVPLTQHQVLHAAIADGIWVLHVISVDTQGRRTKATAHYQFRVGADPGMGRASGHVTGPGGAVVNATVTFNRGVITDQHTNSGGIYDTTTVPAGTWEVTASATGLQPLTKTVVVPANGQIATDFTLVP